MQLEMGNTVFEKCMDCRKADSREATENAQQQIDRSKPSIRSLRGGSSSRFEVESERLDQDFKDCSFTKHSENPNSKSVEVVGTDFLELSAIQNDPEGGPVNLL